MSRAPRSLRDLALALDVEPERLVLLSDRAADCYRPYRDKKGRLIERPIRSLKLLQRTVLELLLAPAIDSPLLRRSHLEAAREHARQPWLGTVDVKACFRSVPTSRVSAVLERLNLDEHAALVLAGLLTYRGHLATGSPASPALVTLLLADLEHALHRVAVEQDARATRWGDDFLFSGEKAAVEVLMREAIRGLSGLGLRVHRGKVSNRQRYGGQRALGLSLDRGLGVPKTYRRKVADQVRAARRLGASKKQLDALAGRIQYVAQTHPAVALELASRLNRGRDSGEG